MRYATAAATLAFAASVSAQGGAFNLKPDNDNPSGCLNDVDYVFSFQPTALGPREGQSAGDAPSKRHLILESRQQKEFDCSGASVIALSLNSGTLSDNRTFPSGPSPRVGSVVANNQFQFDGAPEEGQCIVPQAGAKITTGWCVLSNGSLTLGDQSVFYNCNSGSFDNIYTERTAPEGCQPVRLDTGRCQGNPEKKSIAEFQPEGKNCENPDGSSSSGSSSSSSSSSSSESATSSLSSSESSSASATATTPAENMMSELPSAPAGMFSAPYSAPAAAGTAPAGTASQGVPPSPTGSSTAAPSPFTGAASALEAGQKILAAAAFGAVALLF